MSSTTNHNTNRLTLPRSITVSAENLVVGYNRKPLIRDIRFEIGKGKILTLIGPNGAGKSTILKTISHHLASLGGRIEILSENLSEIDNKSLARRLSVVLTQRLKTERMTVEDVVSMGRYPYTGALGILGAEDQSAVNDAMEMMSVQDLRDCDFNEISDGQRQRVLLARAICQEPDIIVLDEPTSFLDVRHSLELLYNMKKLVRTQGVSILMSLHDLSLAARISDDILCVKGETIAAYGTVDEIFRDPIIKELYGIAYGCYNALTGGVELEAHRSDAPDVFVISGNGTGIPCFRALQRMAIPFSVGILHVNDVDYQVAKHLASEVISSEAFEAIEETEYEAARMRIAQCKFVICTLEVFGSMNQKNRELKEYAQNLGKLKSFDEVKFHHNDT